MSVIDRRSTHDALYSLFIQVEEPAKPLVENGQQRNPICRMSSLRKRVKSRESRSGRDGAHPHLSANKPARLRATRFRPFRSSHRDMHALSVLNPGQALAARSALATTASRPGTPKSRAVVPERGRTNKVVAAASSSDDSSRAVSRVNAAMVACTSLAAGLVAAVPALAEEAASAPAEISPFAGVVDITVLGVVGLLAVQGNKKAEAAKAAGAGKGAKGKKKR